MEKQLKQIIRGHNPGDCWLWTMRSRSVPISSYYQHISIRISLHLFLFCTCMWVVRVWGMFECLCACAFGGQRSILGALPPVVLHVGFMKQSLSLSLELTDCAGQLGSRTQGSSCLSFLSSGNSGASAAQCFLCECWRFRLTSWYLCGKLFTACTIFSNSSVKKIFLTVFSLGHVFLQSAEEIKNVKIGLILKYLLMFSIKTLKKICKCF